MSAYRIDIRRLILSSTRDLRTSVFFRFRFRVEDCFWSFGPVDLPVRREVGCVGAMVAIPTNTHPQFMLLIFLNIDHHQTRGHRLVCCTAYPLRPASPYWTYPLISLAWYTYIIPKSTGSQTVLRRVSAMGIQRTNLLITTPRRHLRHPFRRDICHSAT